MTAVQLEKNDQCSGCGLTDREFIEDPDAFVPMQVTCPWCALKDRLRADGDTSATIPGSSIKLVPATFAKRMASMSAKRPKSRRERAKERA